MASAGRREIDPGRLAALAHCRLRATPEPLCDALGAATKLSAVYRRLLQMLLDELLLPERHREQWDQELSVLFTAHTQPYNGWQKCPVWGWIRHSRSWPK